MFSSGDRYDLSSLLSNQSLTGATGLLGTSGTSPLSTGQDTSGLFQLLLAQMLVKLLDRLEAQVPALTAGLFNSETAASGLSTEAIAPATSSTAIRSAYGISGSTTSTAR
ncbi:MAG TPA: hypothetical protein PK954_18270, partial [Anaerolineales bacterium]|nr:hypothetical protein [Anaerolineales bacterium]